MTAAGPRVPGPPPARLRITAGGAPDPARLAALAAALDALVARPPGPAADPIPSAYRSRWRRAALAENTAVPAGTADIANPWE